VKAKRENYAIMKSMLDSGKSIKEIANTLGVSTKRIDTMRKMYNRLIWKWEREDARISKAHNYQI
jgi:hypothetical protein